MKKIVTLLAVIGMFGLNGCTGPEGPPGPQGTPGEESEVLEFQNVNFSYDENDHIYFFYRKFNHEILASDQILIYRLTGTIDSNTPIWQSVPRTLFLPQGELDYDFDFSKKDFTIYAGGNYDLGLTPDFLKNQTFRIVIVPGYFSTAIDKNNYNAVINALKIDENQIQKIELK